MGTGVEEVAAAEAVKGGTEALGAETLATTAAGAGAGLTDAAAWEAATAGMGEGMGSAAAASDFATATAGMGTGMGDAAAWETATAGMGEGMGSAAAAGAGGAGAWEAATSGMGEGMGSSAAGAGSTGGGMTSTRADLLAGTYGEGMTGAQTGAYDAAMSTTGSGTLANVASGAADAWSTAQPYVNTALSAANKALPYASLANSVMAQNRAGDRLAGVNRNAGRTGEVANQLLSQYQTGQLSGADQQAIVQHKQQQLAAIDQYYQKAGLANSSMHVQARAQAESQAETMRQQALDNTLKSGLQASGVSNQAALSAAQQGFAQDKQAGDTLAEFMKVLGQMNTPQKTTGTPGA